MRELFASANSGFEGTAEAYKQDLNRMEMYRDTLVPTVMATTSFTFGVFYKLLEVFPVEMSPDVLTKVSAVPTALVGAVGAYCIGTLVPAFNGVIRAERRLISYLSGIEQGKIVELPLSNPPAPPPAG